MPGDQHLLTALHVLEQLGGMDLGLEGTTSGPGGLMVENPWATGL
jgi:hypothetical protein